MERLQKAYFISAQYRPHCKYITWHSVISVFKKLSMQQNWFSTVNFIWLAPLKWPQRNIYEVADWNSYLLTIFKFLSNVPVWFLVDHTVHFCYCITLPIIWTYCCKNTVNCYYCTALPILGTVLKSKACNIYKNWSYNGTYWYQGHFKGLTKKTLTLKKVKL